MAGVAPRSRWKRWRTWLVLLLLFFVVGSVIGVEVTSQSSFCNSCHIMESFYDSWSKGTHAEVPCVECHIAPGAQNFISAKLNGLGQVVDDWLNRTSTKPSASVSDFACGREGCHDVLTLDDHPRQDLRFLFKHRVHLGLDYEGIVIRCSTCHSHIKGDRHFEVNTNVCITCHLIDDGVPKLSNPAPSSLAAASHDGNSPSESTPDFTSIGNTASIEKDLTIAPVQCVACHTPPDTVFDYKGLAIDHDEYLQFGAACDSCHRNVTAHSLVIDDSQCLSCHIFGVERIESTSQIHRLHSEGEHKVECFNCHGVIHHGPDAEALPLDQFDCRSCHFDQHTVQQTTYLNGRGDRDGPYEQTAISPMFLVHIDCSGCHVAPDTLKSNPRSGATVARAVEGACDACHHPGFGGQMIPLWQGSTKKIYDEVLGLLPDEMDPWADDCPEAKARLIEVQRLLELVRVDGSWGVHNPLYTQDLIERAREIAIDTRKACEIR